MRAPALPASIDARTARLGSGLVVLAFLLLHFVNLSLGLISTDAMNTAQPWLMKPWRSLPGTALLYGALLVHFSLALRVLYRRRTLRMSFREALQLGLGLLVPFLLAAHVVATRIVPELTGQGLDFTAEVRTLWIVAPRKGAQQAILLVIASGHACLGLWFWLRTKSWFLRAAPPLFAGALLVPLLALLGFAEAGRQVAAMAPLAGAPIPVPGIGPENLTSGLCLLFAAAIAATLAARLYRMWGGRHSRVRVTYPDGTIIAVPAGSTILEASRLAQVPHASICGGRGRCSTCRVRIPTDLHLQPPPSALERATLARFRAAPEVRLACQLRPSRDIAVFPVFATARNMPGHLPDGAPRAASHERELAILFCDLRGFTRRAEQWLPFDTVFVLNRYFGVVGEAVDAAGGYLDKFIGDGALALFGLNVPAEIACRQALDAAARIAQGMDGLNRQFDQEHTEPLRIAMGLHAGHAIVGDMGYGRAVGLTAIGDGINVASRLEGAAKEFDVEAVISSELALKAGLDVSLYPQQRIAVRGRVAPVEALMVASAVALGDMPLPVRRSASDHSDPVA